MRALMSIYPVYWKFMSSKLVCHWFQDDPSRRMDAWRVGRGAPMLRIAGQEFAMARTSTTTGTRAVPDVPDAGTPQEVRQYLDRFARALTRGDTAALVALWEVPALVLGD